MPNWKLLISSSIIAGQSLGVRGQMVVLSHCMQPRYYLKVSGKMPPIYVSRRGCIIQSKVAIMQERHFVLLWGHKVFFLCCLDNLFYNVILAIGSLSLFFSFVKFEDLSSCSFSFLCPYPSLYCSAETEFSGPYSCTLIERLVLIYWFDGSICGVFYHYVS